ncbi:putative secreted protein [Wickerhamomyces ciferrii]|uniref:Secreted protein n=1 Tax=Wickerhamomyces ciferrii (strain ATCC 14091 / BCRC 22168 / CBS 111 / JCM 3599 / NBRC 0793 / NRRL Y-1031 F-60-10) TaxID=1206466 RepID=K0KFA9_WICCF|nr:uncharacterized protein BN7_446 [Wickerhamomyces ciferrii]CCH40912.1 putative secreted protein [Wickerhamomyces ciferrii]
MLLILLLLPLVSCLPPSLTSKSFIPTLQQSNLSLIEFFSPYCSHCKAFEPIWESTLDHFNQSQYNIAMHQVNCVEQGDLCNKEQIRAYPSLKLYGPQGFIQDYPKSLKRKESDLIEFMQSKSIELNTGLDIKSKSIHLTTEQIIKIMGESQLKPWLISFWPSSQLDNLDELNYKVFQQSEYYEDCLTFQRIWSILSNQLTSNSKDFQIGHINCHANSQICKELGLANDFIPQVKFIIPGFDTAKTIDYHGELDTKQIFNFATRAKQISSLTKIDSINLLDQTKIKTKLKSIDTIPEPLENYFIYLFDEKLTTKEDLQILPYLLPKLIESPNTKFFISNDSNLLKILEIQQKNLVNYISSDQQKYEFNEDKFQLNYLSSLPTLINFKELSLSSSIYQSFGPMDSRDLNKLNQFIETHSNPIFKELTPKSLDLKTKESMVILPIQQPGQLDPYLAKIHEYNELISNTSYTQLLNQRSTKQSKANYYKNLNDFKKMIKSLRKEIKQPLYPEPKFFYIDLSKHKELDGLDLIPGDLTIISRGFQYQSYLKDLSKSLLSINKITNGSVHGRLINSPYPDSLRYLDYLHQFGIWGYLGVLSVVIIGIIWRRNKRERDYLPLFEKKNQD